MSQKQSGIDKAVDAVVDMTASISQKNLESAVNDLERYANIKNWTAEDYKNEAKKQAKDAAKGYAKKKILKTLLGKKVLICAVLLALLLLGIFIMWLLYDNSSPPSVYSRERGSESRESEREPVSGGGGGDSAERDYSNEAQWIYFAGTEMATTANLMRVRADGSGLTTLYEGSVIGIAVTDDWVYFMRGETKEPGLYKIRHDGSDLTQLRDVHCGAGKIIVAGDWVYYALLRNVTYAIHNVYRTKTDGSETELFGAAFLNSFTVHDGFIFYAGNDRVTRVCLETKKEEKLVTFDDILPGHDCSSPDGWCTPETSERPGHCYPATKIKFRDVRIHDGRIYLLVSDDGIYSMNPNGTDFKTVVKFPEEHWTTSHEIRVADGWVYYDSRGFRRVRTDGSGDMELFRFAQEYLVVAGSWLYYGTGSYGFLRKIRSDRSIPLPIGFSTGGELEDALQAAWKRGDIVGLHDGGSSFFDVCWCCDPVPGGGEDPPGERPPQPEGGNEPPVITTTPPPGERPPQSDEDDDPPPVIITTPPGRRPQPPEDNDNPPVTTTPPFGPPIFIVIHEGIVIELCKEVYEPGETMTVTVKNLPPEMAAASAFIAIYEAEAEHWGYQEYRYPSAGESEHTFTAPWIALEYEIRLYRQDYVYTDETFVMGVPFRVEEAEG
ncbi:MAG: DUF5050 domain-containing protein [Oscillospiraceae bacterium]|jgi:hypothetical protein|nr:DUF5050 domain-containing protein [Oscillospiraceae bacterium]